jgi:SpoVK/Ycf46/Vps4 family AAA+-type ATPase
LSQVHRIIDAFLRLQGRPGQVNSEFHVVGSDPRKIEADLRTLSQRIDAVLRRHYATLGMLRLLTPPRHLRERGRRVRMHAPSRWLLIASGLLALASAATIWLSPLLSPRWIPSAWMPPELSPITVGIVIAALVLFERLVYPRIVLRGHTFRLMRLERIDAGGEFPCVYTVAPVPDTASGFGWEAWKRAQNLAPGDLVIAVSDAQNNGRGLILLRTEGRLPALMWDRNLLQQDAFPPLPQDVRLLAQHFDRACDRHAAHADRIERSRNLRSGQVEAPAPPVDPAKAWEGVALAPALKQRLATLAAHFVEGRATATHGLLLYGPPGTGKTRIARAFAECMGCTFYPLSLPDLKSGYVGQSGENVKALWRKAVAEPCAVIFVDECETVFGRRGGVGTDSSVEEIVTAFLAQWDGFEKQKHVWVIGATNRRDLIDPALLSRFEDQIEIGLPDDAQRLGILAEEFARLGIPPPLPPRTVALTVGLSGRDLVGLAKRAAREHGTQHALGDEALEGLTKALRKQGSTTTDARASWDTLVLPEATLKELKTTAGLLQHADTFRKRGIGVPRGLLLYGPPGTGKTQVARTLANETGLRFIGASTADIKQGYLGQSGQKVRELFERAREAAPSLLFIDELDIIAATRGGQNDVILTEIVGQLLQEMDGIAAQTQPVFVLAATNRRDQIDPAVLSRLPKQIEIPLPDRDAVARLIAVLLDGKPLSFPVADGARTLAARVDGKSGRDLRSWVESAEHRAVARAIEAGDPDAVAIALADFD